MECDEARELLWPPEEPRLAEGDVPAARRHVETCESCRDYLAQDALLLDSFRNARRIHAPAEVRERIFDALARARTTSGPPAAVQGGRRGLSDRISRPTFVATAAVVLVAALFGVFGPFPGPGSEADRARAPDREAGSAFVEDFLRRAVQAEHIQTSDPVEVARFLARELGTAVGAPVSFPGFDLEGAEVCIVEGIRGAVVLYKQNGRVLYHYLIPRGDGGEERPSLSATIPSRWSGQVSFPSVVTWSSEDLEQALVSDIPPDELLEVARALATQG